MHLTPGHLVDLSSEGEAAYKKSELMALGYYDVIASFPLHRCVIIRPEDFQPNRGPGAENLQLKSTHKKRSHVYRKIMTLINEYTNNRRAAVDSLNEYQYLGNSKLKNHSAIWDDGKTQFSIYQRNASVYSKITALK